MINLAGQVAVVTGGSRGIGAATAILLAEAGADIVILYKKENDSAQKTAKKIKMLNRKVSCFKSKIESFSDCTNNISKTINEFGRVDILVNSGGIWEYGKVGKMTSDQWQRTISINLTGVFNMCSAVLPVMKKQKYGRIVNISNTAGQRGEAFHSHYAASKGGVIAFSKSLAVEVIKDGIWVNSIAPGWVDTDMVSHVFKNSKTKREISLSIPRGKIASSEEIAGPILFLCSDLSNHIVGETINVNGGSVLNG